MSYRGGDRGRGRGGGSGFNRGGMNWGIIKVAVPLTKCSQDAETLAVQIMALPLQ